MMGMIIMIEMVDASNGVSGLITTMIERKKIVVGAGIPLQGHLVTTPIKINITTDEATILNDTHHHRHGRLTLPNPPKGEERTMPKIAWHPYGPCVKAREQSPPALAGMIHPVPLHATKQRMTIHSTNSTKISAHIVRQNLPMKKKRTMNSIANSTWRTMMNIYPPQIPPKHPPTMPTPPTDDSSSNRNEHAPAKQKCRRNGTPVINSSMAAKGPCGRHVNLRWIKINKHGRKIDYCPVELPCVPLSIWTLPTRMTHGCNYWCIRSNLLF
mmetsp:Transcript_33264/g.59910  ORF Transcript_33264/g.59910 Transcript_33264/m.59910 type:complete len:270 (-) Transcript_33264:66-875(-)